MAVSVDDDAAPAGPLAVQEHRVASSTANDFFVLPCDLKCTFAAEGSANAVFRFARGSNKTNQDTTSTTTTTTTTTTNTNTTITLSSYLLRVPKAAPGVSPRICVDHQAYYTSVLQPLLGPDALVGQRLACGVDGLRRHLNGLLDAQDGVLPGGKDPHQNQRPHPNQNQTPYPPPRRRPDWSGSRIADGLDIALLVEDMTAPARSQGDGIQTDNSNSPTATTIQFKPKWLAQSPTAPPGARRCRTCALSAALASKGPGRTSRTPKPCPLVLVAASRAAAKGLNGSRVANGYANGTNGVPASHGTSGARASRASAANRVHGANGANMASMANGATGNGTRHVKVPCSASRLEELDMALWDYVRGHLGPDDNWVSCTPVRTAIVQWLRTTDLFGRLAAIQQEYDPHGALSLTKRTAEDVLDRLQTAMTLRDCTCFLRVCVADVEGEETRGAHVLHVSAKLGDLDRKDGRRRLARWQAQERELLDGGFYMGTEEPRQSTACWLEACS